MAMPPYINKYVVGLAFVGMVVFGYWYLRYIRYCDLELGNVPYALVVNAFDIVLYSTVLLQITQLDNSTLGDLKDEKSAVIIGFVFIVYFTGHEILFTFLDIFNTPSRAD